MQRKYVPYTEKHKYPKGFGTLCPKMTAENAQQLLDRAVPVPDEGANKLWAASGDWCFCAHPSPGAGADAWHGFPVIGGDAPERVLRACEAAGMITPRELRRLRAQRSLPGKWP